MAGSRGRQQEFRAFKPQNSLITDLLARIQNLCLKEDTFGATVAGLRQWMSNYYNVNFFGKIRAYLELDKALASLLARFEQPAVVLIKGNQLRSEGDFLAPLDELLKAIDAMLKRLPNSHFSHLVEPLSAVKAHYECFMTKWQQTSDMGIKLEMLAVSATIYGESLGCYQMSQETARECASLTLAGAEFRNNAVGRRRVNAVQGVHCKVNPKSGVPILPGLDYFAYAAGVALVGEQTKINAQTTLLVFKDILLHKAELPAVQTEAELFHYVQAISLQDEIIQAGETIPGLLVSDHFVLQKAFRELSPQQRSELTSTLQNTEQLKTFVSAHFADWRPHQRDELVKALARFPSILPEGFSLEKAIQQLPDLDKHFDNENISAVCYVQNRLRANDATEYNFIIVYENHAGQLKAKVYGIDNDQILYPALIAGGQSAAPTYTVAVKNIFNCIAEVQQGPVAASLIQRLTATSPEERFLTLLDMMSEQERRYSVLSQSGVLPYEACFNGDDEPILCIPGVYDSKILTQLLAEEIQTSRYLSHQQPVSQLAFLKAQSPIVGAVHEAALQQANDAPTVCDRATKDYVHESISIEGKAQALQAQSMRYLDVEDDRKDSLSAALKKIISQVQLKQYMQTPQRLWTILGILSHYTEHLEALPFSEEELNYLLQQAAADNNAGAVSLLLKVGADPNVLNPQGLGPIHLALGSTQSNPAVAKLLLNHPQARLDLLDGKNNPPSFYIPDFFNEALIRAVLQSDLDLDAVNPASGDTRLDLEIANGNHDSIKQLIALGAGARLKVAEAYQYFQKQNLPEVEQQLKRQNTHYALYAAIETLTVPTHAEDKSHGVLQGCFSGPRKLKPAFINQVFPQPGAVKRDNQSGVHDVAFPECQGCKLAIKMEPEAWILQYFAELMMRAISPHGGVTASEFFVTYDKKGRPVPLQISPFNDGAAPEVFNQVGQYAKSAQEKKAIFDALDPREYAYMFVLLIWIIGGDGKWDQFKLQDFVNHLGMPGKRLMAHDMDQNSTRVVMSRAERFQDPKEVGRQLQLIATVLCLDQMQQAFDPYVRKRISERLADGKSLVATLESLAKVERWIKTQFNAKDIENYAKRTNEKGQPDGVILTSPLSVTGIRRQMVRMQATFEVLDKQPTASYLDVLKAVVREAWAVYQPLHANLPFADQRFAQLATTLYTDLIDGQIFSSVQATDDSSQLSEVQLAIAPSKTSRMNIDEIVADLKQGNIQRFKTVLFPDTLEKVLETLDFASLKANTQQAVLDHLISHSSVKRKKTKLSHQGFDLQKLILRNCTALTNDTLFRLIENMPSLQQLDLSGCTSLDFKKKEASKLYGKKDKYQILEMISQSSEALAQLTLSNLPKLIAIGSDERPLMFKTLERLYCDHLPGLMSLVIEAPNLLSLSTQNKQQPSSKQMAHLKVMGDQLRTWRCDKAQKFFPADIQALLAKQRSLWNVNQIRAIQGSQGVDSVNTHDLIRYGDIATLAILGEARKKVDMGERSLTKQALEAYSRRLHKSKERLDELRINHCEKLSAESLVQALRTTNNLIIPSFDKVDFTNTEKVLNSAGTALFLSNDRLVTISDQTKTPLLWELKNHQWHCVTSQQTAHRNNLLAIVANGGVFYTTGYDRSIVAWNKQSNLPEKILSGVHANPVHALCSFGRFVISGDSKSEIAISDVAAREKLARHQKAVFSITTNIVQLDEEHFITTSNKGYIALWQWQSPTSQVIMATASLKGEPQITAVQVCGAMLFAVATKDHRIFLLKYDQALKALELVHCLYGHTDVVNDLHCLLEGELLLSVSDDHTVRLWDMVTGEAIKVCSFNQKVQQVEQSADGLYLHFANGDLGRYPLPLQKYSLKAFSALNHELEIKQTNKAVSLVLSDQQGHCRELLQAFQSIITNFGFTLGRDNQMTLNDDNRSLYFVSANDQRVEKVATIWRVIYQACRHQLTNKTNFRQARRQRQPVSWGYKPPSLSKLPSVRSFAGGSRRQLLLASPRSAQRDSEPVPVMSPRGPSIGEARGTR